MDSDDQKIDPNKKDKAFEILVRQHHRRLLAYAGTITRDPGAAPDIVQDAFVAAYRNLDKFDVSRDFGSWIRGIVRNKCKEWGRSRKFVPLDEQLLEKVEAQHREWDEREAASGTKLFAALHDCIAKLPDLMSQAVQLFYMKRLSGAEVASRVGADEAAVRKRLQRARGQLGECITKKLGTAS